MIPYGQDYADFMLSKNSRNTYSFMMAARMFVDEQILTRGYENVEKFGACVAGMPSKDTVKLVDEDQFAVNTPPRKINLGGTDSTDF